MKKTKWAILGMATILCIFTLTPFAFGARAQIGVRVILASQQGKVVDPHLQDIQKSLDTLNYSSYKLLHEEVFFLAKGETGQLILTGKRELNFKLLQEKAGEVEIAIEILQGSKVIFKTTARLKQGGNLLIGGPRHEDGVLILAIAAQGS